MPVVFRHKGIRIFFFSNEGVPREPIHVHAQRGECLAKVWVQPTLQLADSFGFTSAELRDILDVIEQNVELIEEAWNEHFS